MIRWDDEGDEVGWLQMEEVQVQQSSSGGGKWRQTDECPCLERNTSRSGQAP